MTRDCRMAMPACSRRWPVVRRTGGRYRRRLAAEQHAAAVYRALAARRTGEDREILLALVVAGLAQQQRARASGWFRTAIFGANDGLVSNFSLVAGMAGAGSSSRVILLAGLAGLLAGALSMAAGEYISVRSQRELLEAAAPELDPATLAALREHEESELALVFRARGLSLAQAEQRAAALFDLHGDPSPAAVEAGGARGWWAPGAARPRVSGL